MSNSSLNIPGYTGFVPFKSNFVGRTVCDANRDAEKAFKKSIRDFSLSGLVIRDIHEGALSQRSTCVNVLEQQPENRMILGNHSKNSKTWINGPTHEIRNQCLPGYTGFIPGVKAENVYS